MLSPAAKSKIAYVGERYPKRKSAILPALHIAYDEHGYLSEEMYREIAETLDLKFIEVVEAASFYTYFPKAKRGKFYIQICHNISCALLGARHLTEYICSKLGIEPGETTADHLFTVVEVECLGSCSTAPMMQINDDYYENLTQAKVDQILEELRKKA